MNYGYSTQMPVYQEGQFGVRWLNKVEDLKLVVAGKVTYPKIKATAKIMRGDTVLGYSCRDEAGRNFSMKSRDIKLAINSKKLHFYNLRVTVDNRLVHDTEDDRLGLDVPPNVYFSYLDNGRNLRMYYDGTSRMVIFLNTKTNKHLKFRISLFNNNRAWMVQCCGGDMIDFTKTRMNSISDVLYRDRGSDELNKFISKLLTIVANNRASNTTTDESYRQYFEREWDRRFEYLNDYQHGHSEDKEKAFYALKNLKENHLKYGKRWDLSF